ncbi:LON peptidase substrate-binding domain-containing protein [Sphingobium sufflavum]|uniref:LON peptidase substrate-binding domain-containing protein n=1 Tax=Sphingobium sufflavum TaxID=1129547 RepID=UPI001F1E30C9|nr:LON peptidase substrate-binding domain-containing protein [Sphingobium sufflavum]MCE7797441.1 LON peptidase substrate-binding domain-containing protein [Sphingobium sufflavum]
MTRTNPSTTRRLSIFPLGGAILYPRMQLPLHIFEPRYRALVSDAMARDQRIGMIQPRGPGDPPALFDIGCIGRIGEIEALEDGRFNIVLEGEARFRLVRELDVTTAFRQVEATVMTDEQDDPGILASSERAALEYESRIFADKLGYSVDWNAVGRLDDETFVNAIAQIAPFDDASKQALLEVDRLNERSEMLMQLMQFHGRGDTSGQTRLQ